jgi:hypothetical protein
MATRRQGKCGRFCVKSAKKMRNRQKWQGKRGAFAGENAIFCRQKSPDAPFALINVMDY